MGFQGGKQRQLTVTCDQTGEPCEAGKEAIFFEVTNMYFS